MVPDQTLPPHARAEMCMQPIVFSWQRSQFGEKIPSFIKNLTTESKILKNKPVNQCTYLEGMENVEWIQQ